MQRHPDAVVILWNLKDYDHVVFVTLSQLVPCLKDMSADHWSMIVFWNESSSKKPSSKPDVGLDYTDEPVPLPPPTWTLEDSPKNGGDDGMQGPPGYQDPDVDVGTPGDDDDTPHLGGTGSGCLPLAPGAPDYPGHQLPPDFSSDGIELQYGHGGFPPHYPNFGSGTRSDDAEPAAVAVPNEGDDDDDHPPYPMEVHVEPPPPGGPPDAPGAKQTFANPDQYMQPQPHVPASQPIVPTQKHPHFPIPQVMRPPSFGMRR